MKLAAITLACAAAFAAAAGPVLADPVQPPQDLAVHSARVSYADLDLASDAGAATLVLRVQAAARRVCEDPFPVPLALERAARECRKNAADRAIASLGSPRVSRIYAKAPAEVIQLATAR